MLAISCGGTRRRLSLEPAWLLPLTGCKRRVRSSLLLSGAPTDRISAHVLARGWQAKRDSSQTDARHSHSPTTGRQRVPLPPCRSGLSRLAAAAAYYDILGLWPSSSVRLISPGTAGPAKRNGHVVPFPFAVPPALVPSHNPDTRLDPRRAWPLNPCVSQGGRTARCKTASSCRTGTCATPNRRSRSLPREQAHSG